jgi:hypothetical protein
MIKENILVMKKIDITVIQKQHKDFAYLDSKKGNPTPLQIFDKKIN